MAHGWVAQVLCLRKCVFGEMWDLFRAIPGGPPRSSLLHVAWGHHETEMAQLPDSVGEETGAQKSQEGGLHFSGKWLQWGLTLEPLFP